MSTDDSVTFDCTYVSETDRAVLVNVEDEEIWLPKSQVDDLGDNNERGDELTLSIPEWLADQHGIC